MYCQTSIEMSGGNAIIILLQDITYIVISALLPIFYMVYIYIYIYMHHNLFLMNRFKCDVLEHNASNGKINCSPVTLNLVLF